jgi:hypothetical protein
MILHITFLLKPMLGGVDGSLHLTVPSMNRPNRAVPATFSICHLGLSLEIHIFSISRDNNDHDNH